MKRNQYMLIVTKFNSEVYHLLVQTDSVMKNPNYMK